MDGFSFVGTGEILALASGLSYTIALIALRQGFRSGSPLAGVFVGNIIVSLAGLTAAFFLGTLQKTAPPAILWFMLGGCLSQGLGHLVSFVGIERLGVSRAVPVQASAPIWGVLFAVAFLAERPGVAVWLGTVLIVAGLMVISRVIVEEESSSENLSRGALIFPITASLFYAIGPVAAKTGFAHQATPMVAIGFAFGVSIPLLLLVKPLLPGGGVIRADARALRWFVLAGVSTTAAAGCFWSALAIANVSTVLPLSRMTPLWVAIFSYLFLGHLERVTPLTFLAAGLVVLGGTLIMSA